MTAPLANNTEALFRATVGLNIAFAFAHHVFTPHYHHDASIEVEISCSVRNEPAARSHAMGVDVVDLRHSMEALISKHLGHRLVVWGPELSQARSMALDVEPGSIAPPPLEECVWPVRPTLEALSTFSLLLTEVSLADLAPTDAAVTSLLFRETPRSFVRLSTDQLPAAREFAAESFRDMLSL